MCFFLKVFSPFFNFKDSMGSDGQVCLNMATERSKFQLKNIAESFPKPVIYPCQLNLLQCYPTFVS